MAEIPFTWELVRTSNVHPKKNRFISSLTLNEEWSIVCLWSRTSPNKPGCIEFRRNSTSKEILVSGTFKLMQYGVCLLQRKFMQLIEAGFETTQLELEYSRRNHNRQEGWGSNSNYYITGSLIIPVDESPEEYADVQNKHVNTEVRSLMHLSGDFEALLDPKCGFFSDVNITCGSVAFSAHKTILCARSPVFAAMFTTQMKENRDSKVNITDLSPHVLKTMLTYVYGGKTGELSFQSASDLLFAADKYQLQDLKRVCCDFLKNCASAENVLKILVLGEFHDKDLKGFAMDFICNSYEEFEVLEKTEEWENLREKIPSLAMDVLTGLVKSTNKKLKTYK